MTAPSKSSPTLYTEWAEWWPLLSAPGEYAEEAGVYSRCLLEAAAPPARTLLELGSGGGNNASHMKQRFELTLVDLSPAMLAVSRRLNPECEHIEGDMRSVRLGRLFDCVFIQDAIGYMTSYEDLCRAIGTAAAHCRPGGAALFAPDFVRETFQPGTAHGGHDGPDRSLRYLEWTWDPDPADQTFVADYVYVLRDERGEVRAVQDRHVEGLFSREEWLSALSACGFAPRRLEFRHSEVEGGPMDMFLGVKPAG